MNIRPVKRKCYVRGCKNTDCLAVSKTREMGNSIIICRDCAKEILDAIKDYKEPEKPVKTYTGAPPLFFNGVTEIIEQEAKQDTEAQEDKQEEPKTKRKGVKQNG